jgi:hypothetical protein
MLFIRTVHKPHKRFPPRGGSWRSLRGFLTDFRGVFALEFKRPFENLAIFGASFLGNLMAISG